MEASLPDYPVVQIEPAWVLEPEGMGSKDKFWYRRADDEPRWLFKFPQENTGQHWAEKIAAELAELMGIFHAKVELAVFDGARGSATESFARDGRELWHGNQILAGKVFGYDSTRRFRQSDHTLEHIFQALDATFESDDGRTRAKRMMADYLVLDAVIGNTDRHHENWGILRKKVGDRWTGIVAPSFDHASSLGRELRDDGEGKTRWLTLSEGRVGRYVEKAPGAIYWSGDERKGPSPLQIVRQASEQWPDLFQGAIRRVEAVTPAAVVEIMSRMPVGWMSQASTDFVGAFLAYSVEELRKMIR